MYELKTKENDADVIAFINKIEDAGKREDCIALVNILAEATGQKAKMWGTAIVGFGSYHYKYDSGHEGDSCAIGFSPRKANITFYLMLGLQDASDLLAKLGKYKTGKGCLYLNKLADADLEVLKKLASQAYKAVKQKYPN